MEGWIEGLTVGQSVGIVGGFDGDLGLGVVLVLVQSIQGPLCTN